MKPRDVRVQDPCFYHELAVRIVYLPDSKVPRELV